MNKLLREHGLRDIAKIQVSVRATKYSRLWRDMTAQFLNGHGTQKEKAEQFRHT